MKEDQPIILDGLISWTVEPFDPAKLPEGWAGRDIEIEIILPPRRPTFHEKERARNKARKARKRERRGS